MATPAVTSKSILLAIIEFGGYPNFSSLYKRLGYEVVIQNSMRKALHYLKRHIPNVIVAEFNYQSAFRDRVSSLESLVAVVERRPEVKVIVFLDQEYRHQFERLKLQYSFFDAIPYPIDEERLVHSLRRAG